MTAGRNSAESLSQHWCTPPKYVDVIREFFGGTIALDPCSNSFSIVNAEVEYALPYVDGLNASWDYPSVYINPPYGRDRSRGTTILHWLKMAVFANRYHGSEVLALVPVAPNTKHWKRYIFGAATAVAFLYDTRLKFLVDGKSGGKGAPMACAMVYWGSMYRRFEHYFLPFGAVCDIRHLHGKPIGSGRQLDLWEERAMKSASMR